MNSKNKAIIRFALNYLVANLDDVGEIMEDDTTRLGRFQGFPRLKTQQ